MALTLAISGGFGIGAQIEKPPRLGMEATVAFPAVSFPGMTVSGRRRQGAGGVNVMTMSDTALEPPLFARQLSRRQLVGWDVAVAGAYIAVMLNVTSLTAGRISLIAASVTVGIGVLLAVRRVWPVPVFWSITAITVAALLADVIHDSFIAAALALYIVATVARGPRWFPHRTIAVLAVTGAVVLTVAGPVGVLRDTAGSLLLGVVVLGASWTLGTVVRDRRAVAARSARRLAQRMVAEERLHIARELHDVVAHSMSLIAVKSAVANHVAAKRPDEAFAALRVIEATSKTALAEMRQLLGVLRSAEDEAQLAPAPGLDGLPDLVEHAAQAGVRVTLDAGDLTGLPRGVDLSAFRIVQEAVTNVIKHAAPANCDVAVSIVDEEVRISVSDDGPGARALPSNPDGHGLTGMAERVAVYNGQFAAGPGADGGFTVTATIPFAQALTGARR